MSEWTKNVSINIFIINFNRHFAYLIMDKNNGVARLEMLEDMKFRILEHYTIDLVASPEDVVTKSISYRFNSM